MRQRVRKMSVMITRAISSYKIHLCWDSKPSDSRAPVPLIHSGNWLEDGENRYHNNIVPWG